MHVVVIGAVALGPKAASRFKRLMPDAKVTLIDQSTRISYGGCGIPFYVSGEINRVEELQETPYGTIRDAVFFKTAKDIDVLTQTQATKINRAKKEVEILNLVNGETKTLKYDKLVLALGSRPNKPPIPGIDLKGISPATNLDEAEQIKKNIISQKVNDVVVVGGGFIGLEMAVGIADMWGLPTSIVEIASQILPGFVSPTFAKILKNDLTAGGINTFVNEKVLKFEGKDGKIEKVITDKRELPADLVILSAGITPNTEIAKEAGINVNERGQIVVNEYLQSSDPDIYAGGDCVTIRNLVTGKPGFYPLGSLANREGRVIGTNLASDKTGKKATFKGAVGTWGIKLSSLSACGTGLSFEVAKREGFDAISVHVEQLDRAHFYPGKGLMSMELVVEKNSKRILGVQALGPNGDAVVARINPVVPLLINKADISELSNLEVVYTPPFASAMDIINTLGNVAENILEGRNRPIILEDFLKGFKENKHSGHTIIDARVAKDAKVFVEKYPDVWYNIPQDELDKRFGEIPKDKPVILICNTGLRSFEAQASLDRLGFHNTRTVQGGMAGIKKLGGLE
ncbi:FAD-dependent oxidoreductase [Desulfovibrio litoralis]|uniref:NADPH-dependent 2,4-dienoyl-CoA reductase, sulfur reductase n=1 Tax=Desulfovibrio litoralis DSM 11393 TaxID=1121455 RepID=A0A1M7SKY9_9BACT|nr:FAD-dependent oxidoreductase [Desulfovibrio litoralis]SHN59068.1 NADPH-dependent 2,4-dienoyl-CoA reductase, sulfur reductase [Desulfovibrio litoralis DSM 11393]